MQDCKRTFSSTQREVFTRLRQAGLKIKPAKCHLMQKSVTSLGHIISEHGVETDPEKTHIIRHWPSPRSLQELKSFLGLASYYCKFIRGFARIAAPLHQLTRKEHSWNWTDQCEEAFSTLKLHLISSPVLAYPFECRFIFRHRCQQWWPRGPSCKMAGKTCWI